MINTWEMVGAVAGAIMAGGVVIPRIAAFLGRSGLRTTASSTVDIYRENNEALREQNDLRVAEIHELTTKLDTAEALVRALQKQVDSQQEQIKNLRELVLQVKGLADLKQQIEDHHRDVMKEIGRIGRGTNGP